MANKENNEKTSEETIELSVDDLEEASGGVIVDLGDGRYTTTDEFNGHTYYIGDNLGRAREVATTHDISTRVMTESEYVMRTGRQP